MTPAKKIIACLTLCALLGAAPARAGKGMSIIRDEEIEQSIKTMTKQVLAQAGLSTDTVKFVLIDAPELNAFVAGGQNIFLHTGLLLETRNPEELLGVVAHESGHIADGHLFRSRAEVSNLSLQAVLANLLGIAVAIGARSPDAGIAISNATGSIAMRSLLRHTRTQEGAADQAGIRFLRSAEMPLTGFLSFMEKLESQELLPETQQSEYVQTHPLTQDRIDVLRRAVEQGPPGKIPPAFNELHHRMKAKLLGYLFPDKALREKGDSIATRYGHAIAWFRKNKPGKALATLEPLLKEEPENPYFWEFRGQMLFENGRIEESIPAYARAVELAPLSGLIRVSYAHSLLESKEKKDERLKEAIRQLTLALRTEKQISEPHHLLGIAYGKQGQVGMMRLHLAEEALMQDRKDFARREATLAKANLPKGTPAYQRAADILNALEKSKKEEKPEEND